jgi:hypothetical protein
VHHLLAYIDPGSGSLFLQMLIAAVLAVPFFFRRTISDAWHRVRRRNEDEPSASSHEAGRSGPPER